MAIRQKTITFPYTTQTSSLATNTTLGTATEATFSRTITMETSSRTIRNVCYEIVAHDEFAAAADFDGLRVGSKINAVAQSDTDITLTLVDTGDHETFFAKFDATSYWVTNDPGTNTFTAEVHLRFATETAQNVNGINVLVHITYDYDDTSSTHYKTVCVPIQSEHGQVSTTYVAVGTSGTSPAPANQIPAWSTVLPETGKTILEEWVDVQGFKYQGATCTPTLRIDGATDQARFAISDALVTGRPYIDRLSTNGLSGAGGALEVKSDVTNGLELVGGFAYVTYAFDPLSLAHWVSLRVPLTNGLASSSSTSLDSAAADQDQLVAHLYIEEPGAITMQQSGVVIQVGSNNTTRLLRAPGQTARTYTFANSSPRTNSTGLIHRGDHSSSTWTLVRGNNFLPCGIYASAETLATSQQGGYALVNYTCGRAASGCGSHARSVLWNIAQFAENTGSTRDVVSPTAPTLPEASWTLIASFARAWARFNHAGAVHTLIGARRETGEFSGDGWQTSVNLPLSNSTWGGEVATMQYAFPTTEWWRAASYVTDPHKLDLENTRDWQVHQGISGSAVVSQYHVDHWITYHSITYTVRGEVTINGAAPANGKTVKIFAIDTDNSVELVASPTTTGGTGTFSATVTSTRDHYAIYDNDGNLGVSKLAKPYSTTTGAPYFVGVGTFESDTVGGENYPPSWPWPAGHQVGDIGLLVQVTADTTPTHTAPAGYALTDDSPQSTTGRQLSVSWKRAASTAEAAAAPGTAPDMGEKIGGQILVWRDCVATGNPWDVTAGDTAASAAAVSIPGDTSTVPNTEVVGFVAAGINDYDGNLTNASLVSITERSHQMTDANACGFLAASGEKAAAGAFNATTLTLDSAAVQARITIALKPRDDFDITIGGGGGIVPPRVGSTFIR